MVSRDIASQVEEVLADSESPSYLLAILPEKDFTHHLFRDFLDSLGDTGSILFNSNGYFGDLTENAVSRFRKNSRRFLVIKTYNNDELDDSYFSSSLDAALIDIADEARVCVMYKAQDCWQAERHNGTIEQMLALYSELQSASKVKLIEEAIKKFEYMRQNMTKRAWFGLGKMHSVPMDIGFGLEISQYPMTYLVSTTGMHGPYVAEIT